MATWKKVIVSGSAADLASLSLDTALPVGSGGTGASTLTDGGILLGSGAGAVTALGQATNGQIPIGSTGGDPVLATISGGSNITVTNGAGSISIAATGLGSGTVTSVGGEGTVNGLTLSGVVTTSGSITLGGTLSVPNSALVNDGLMIGSTDISLGATGSSLAGLSNVTSTALTVGNNVISGSNDVADSRITGSFTGSFTGAFTGTSNLPDLTDGNGIADFTYDGASTAQVAVQADGSTLTVGASGVKITDGGVAATQLATSVAGDGLTGGGGTALAVQVDDSTIEISADTLQIKSVPNTKLANDGLMIGSSDISLGTTASSIAGLTSLTSTAVVGTNVTASTGLLAGTIINASSVAGTKITGSFTGSFKGDGSNLSGVASTLAVTGSGGTPTTVALKTQALSILAGEGIDSVATAQTITISGENAAAANKGIASFSDSNFTVSSGDVSLSSDVTIGQDLIVSRNLTVQGTASFQATEDLDVADRFIRMASGSTSTGDGGIVIQQSGPTPAVGEAFAYDAATLRWGTTSSFDPSTNAVVPDAFMTVAIEGSGGAAASSVVAKYTKKGNMFISASGDIWIYS